MLQVSLQKNDSRAKWLIGIFSFIVFTAIAVLGRVKLNIQLGFNVHIFAMMNAFINTVVAIILIAALIAVKKKKYLTHKRLMIAALILSVIFLIFYVVHHLLSGETKYGDINHDGIISPEELVKAGALRTVYFLILAIHIFLAAIILPFILFTAYRALIGEFSAHKKIARYTWPLWFYVALSGPFIYLMIRPYYG